MTTPSASSLAGSAKVPRERKRTPALTTVAVIAALVASAALMNVAGWFHLVARSRKAWLLIAVFALVLWISYRPSASGAESDPSDWGSAVLSATIVGAIGGFIYGVSDEHDSVNAYHGCEIGTISAICALFAVRGAAMGWRSFVVQLDICARRRNAGAIGDAAPRFSRTGGADKGRHRHERAESSRGRSATRTEEEREDLASWNQPSLAASARYDARGREGDIRRRLNQRTLQQSQQRATQQATGGFGQSSRGGHGTPGVTFGGAHSIGGAPTSFTPVAARGLSPRTPRTASRRRTPGMAAPRSGTGRSTTKSNAAAFSGAATGFSGTHNMSGGETHHGGRHRTHHSSRHASSAHGGRGGSYDGDDSVQAYHPSGVGGVRVREDIGVINQAHLHMAEVVIRHACVPSALLCPPPRHMHASVSPRRVAPQRASVVPLALCLPLLSSAVARASPSPPSSSPLQPRVGDRRR